MTKAEREAFLAETHVAVISIADGNRAPLTVPIWYGYRPGEDVRMVTAPTSRKARLLKKAGRLSLCVQSESPPYKYVSIEGPAIIGDVPDYERDIRQVALRYLGPQMGEMYLQASASEREAGGTVLIRLAPERWLTVDYAKMAG